MTSAASESELSSTFGAGRRGARARWTAPRCLIVRGTLCPLHQLPQHIGQDAAVLIVIDLDGRIDAAADGHVFGFAFCPRNAQRQILLRLETWPESEHVELLRAV